jgi:hypothetical protein
LTPLDIFVCDRCGRAAFPRRILCPDCGSAEWRRHEAGPGTVEEVTVLRRGPGRDYPGVRIGSVRLDEGPLVVARLEPGAAAGSRVRLRDDGGAPVAAPLRS